ncbi:hypothetical protein [Micromonospora antibiotica]|uniref:Uncharacterized protein n=1 Tax=Micromonospora antibiotica TaxID=2807623 RepID=A0ABS3V4D1_9ACTN|nr:hypothetical protein [Micromonospora antibiotica]MBO4160478.1 hypothetical protein [Micromonospora antibiotica]
MKRSELQVADLAQRMRANRESKVSSALVIGLDGGAALLNHARPTRFVDALRGDRAPTKNDDQKIGDFWAFRSSSLARDDFLKRYTTPTDAADGDLTAIANLAELMNQGYFNAVMVTDPARYLYEHLCRHMIAAGSIVPRHIEAVGHKPSMFDLRRQGSERARPVLVDAAEMLIAGLEPTRLDEHGTQLRDMRAALVEFLDDFDVVYGWGWCRLNVPLSTLYRKLTPLYLLGRYSLKHSWVEADFHLVVGDESEDDEDATTDILNQLAESLGLSGAASSAAVPPTASPSAGWTVLRPEATPPLLTVDQLAGLRESAFAGPVTLIGIDGERTRRRTAEWLLAGLDEGLSSAGLRGGADLTAIGRWLGLRARGADTVVVGELCDLSSPDPGFWVRLTAVIEWWRESVDPNGSHIVLFCPLAVTDWARANYGRGDTVRVEALPEQMFVTVDAVVEWITRELGPLLAWLDEDCVARLGGAIMQVDALPESDPDWLHDALDIWRQEVGLTISRVAAAGRAPADGAPDADVPADGSTGGLSVEELGRLWSEVVRRLADATEAIQPVFTVDPVPRHDAATTPDPQDGAPDFQIDPRPHPPDGADR